MRPTASGLPARLCRRWKDNLGGKRPVRYSGREAPLTARLRRLPPSAAEEWSEPTSGYEVRHRPVSVGLWVYASGRERGLFQLTCPRPSLSPTTIRLHQRSRLKRRRRQLGRSEARRIPGRSELRRAGNPEVPVRRFPLQAPRSMDQVNAVELCRNLSNENDRH